MPACEKCWNIARERNFSDPSKSVTDHYYNVMAEAEKSDHPCSPKEKAGDFWDEENQCDTRPK